MHQAAPVRAMRPPRCGAANPDMRRERCARVRSWSLLFLVVGHDASTVPLSFGTAMRFNRCPASIRPRRRRRMLTPLQLQRYRDDGYLVLPGFKSAPAVRALRERALAIV